MWRRSSRKPFATTRRSRPSAPRSPRRARRHDKRSVASRPSMQPDALQVMIDRALARSAATLSEMSGVDIAISSVAVERVRLVDIPAAVGRPDEPAVGVYVGIEGDGAGYLLLLMDEPMANDLAALLL